MLIGEPGSGDPLAYERISISGVAAQVVDETDRAAVREAYLAKHPKSKLYIDFKDFTFWRLNPERAGYVVGFGKAYLLSASDLDICASGTSGDRPGRGGGACLPVAHPWFSLPPPPGLAPDLSPDF